MASLQPTRSVSLTARGVTKRFGDRVVLDGFDLTLDPGSRTSLVGPNGSGKTTLLRIIAGVLNPDAGTVTIAPATRSAVAFAPPGDRALHLRLTASRNLEFFAAISDAGPQAAQQALDLFEAGHLADRVVASCSSGERRRIALARAFATRAPVILIDEPYSDLDDDGRGHLDAASAAWTSHDGIVLFAMPTADAGPHTPTSIAMHKSPDPQQTAAR